MQAELPLEPGGAPETGIKRSQSQRETTSLDLKIKEEPDVKRQRLDDQNMASPQQPPNIIDIDPTGDLLFLFESDTAYKVDWAAIKRTSPKLYADCLAVRPADGFTWTLKMPEKYGEEPAVAILNLIHANMDKIPDSMGCAEMHNSLVFAQEYEMLGRFSGSLKQWYQNIRPNCCQTPRNKLCNCGRLWITYRLGLQEEFKALQKWAILNLSDLGTGALGDSLQNFWGNPLQLSGFFLAEKAVADRITRLRSEAITSIMMGLREIQQAMVPSGQFGKDGRINIRHGGRGCSKCLDLWFGLLGRSMLRPAVLESAALGRDFPSLSSVRGSKEYHQPLEKLCTFVEAVQSKMSVYVACNRKGHWACCPPQLVGRTTVEDLIAKGLQAPLGAT